MAAIEFRRANWIPETAVDAPATGPLKLEVTFEVMEALPKTLELQLKFIPPWEVQEDIFDAESCSENGTQDDSGEDEDDMDSEDYDENFDDNKSSASKNSKRSKSSKSSNTSKKTTAMKKQDTTTTAASSTTSMKKMQSKAASFTATTTEHQQSTSTCKEPSSTTSTANIKASMKKSKSESKKTSKNPFSKTEKTIADLLASACLQKQEQLLDEVECGPFPKCGKRKIVMEGIAPDMTLVPETAKLDNGALVMIALYNKKQFYRCGWYLTHLFKDDELQLAWDEEMKRPATIDFETDMLRRVDFEHPIENRDCIEWFDGQFAEEDKGLDNSGSEEDDDENLSPGIFGVGGDFIGGGGAPEHVASPKLKKMKKSVEAAEAGRLTGGASASSKLGKPAFDIE
ncbi:unnamed protein product [Amoebophrya sp. A120]|nr:unnamed protein product [Amoebophrya sp. A120]|eukprot:GSA120T00009397001.1